MNIQINLAISITFHITHLQPHTDQNHMLLASQMHRSSDVTITRHNRQFKDLSSTLLLTARRERLTLMFTDQKLWLTCLLSISSLNLCLSLSLSLSLCLVPLRHTLSTSHTPLLTHAALLVCRSVPSMSQTHTCSKHRHDGFQPHKSTCERRKLHTRPQSVLKCVSHTCSRSLQTHTHTHTHRDTKRCSLLVFAICMPSFALLLL